MGNELWEYNMQTGYWTWHGGSTPASGASYGAKGVAAASNWPGAIAGATSHWTLGNKCYMIGGGNQSSGNELWEYDISTGIWTWLNGAKNTALN